MVPKKLTNKMLHKKYSMQIINKCKSDDISSINLINKLSNINNNKISKMPVNFRYSCQNKNMFLSNKALNNENKDCDNNYFTHNYNNETSTKKDKDYYLNLLNEIYLNDSHLSNNHNEIKKESSNKISKKIVKKKTCNFSKYKFFNDNQIIKKTKSPKKLSLNFNYENKNKLNEKNNKMINNKNEREKKGNSKSKLCIKENTQENQNNQQFSSENCIYRFKTTKALVKVKPKVNYKKLRSSQVNIDEDKYIKKILNEPIEHKELSKLKSKNKNKLGSNKRSRNIGNQFKNEKVSLENTVTQNMSSKNTLNVTKKKYIKMYKTCFCCLVKNNDDSF